MEQIKDLSKIIGKTIIGVEEVFDASSVIVFNDNSFCICFGNIKEGHIHTEKGIFQQNLKEEGKVAEEIFKKWREKSSDFETVMEEYKHKTN